jgi:hypothetical protein
MPDTGALTVYARNARERFEINRDGNGLPMHVSVYTQNSQKPSRVDGPMQFYLSFPLASFHIQGSDVSDGITRGRVTVKRLGAKDGSGRVAGTVSISDEGEKGTEYTDYEVVFLPDRGWAISEWSVSNSNGTARGKIQYFDSVLGGRYPSLIINENLDKAGEVFAKAEYQFAEPKACDLAEEGFTLISYGLTPAGAIAPVGRASLWRRPLFISNLVVLGLLISWIWWRSYRAAENN